MKRFNLGGLILVLLGLAFLVDTWGLVPGGIVGRVWPLILLAVGLYIFSVNKWRINAGGAILVLLGIFFFIDSLGWLPFSIAGSLWPLILVVVGVYLLSSR